MHVLITGGFGNVGISVIRELSRRPHDITVFELQTEKNEKVRKKLGKIIDVAWGNLLDPASVSRVMDGKDVVIHLAGIIPPRSEENEALCFKVNVDGTINVINAIKNAGKKPGLIFTSSASVMGPTQDKEPPISPYGNLVPTSNYTRSKVEAERAIRESGITYCICRLGAVLSSQSSLDTSIVKEMFNMKLDNRMEMVLDLDVATALANAAELMAKGDALHGKILNIGGGKENGFQGHGRDLSTNLLKRMGLGALNEDCFSKQDYFIDWMDTSESQSLLAFQNHTFDEAMTLFLAPFKKFKPFLKLFGPIIRKSLERQSPFCQGR